MYWRMVIICISLFLSRVVRQLTSKIALSSYASWSEIDQFIRIVLL